MTVRAIPPEVADKVAAILPRLASNHDGEVVATARAVMRVLNSARCDLHDLTAAFRQVSIVPPQEPRSAEPDFDFEYSADWCRQYQSDPRLSERDRGFLKSMRHWFECGRTPTAAQSKWLDDIWGRVG
jgi:hypothetical protein